jgi:hypothetical protein
MSSTAIQFRGTVHDLAEAELCYAPQFGAAKDPVNLAGMLTELVQNQVDMHRQMSMMHDHMLSQMPHK